MGVSYGGIQVFDPRGTINASRRLDEGPGAAPDFDVEFAKAH